MKRVKSKYSLILACVMAACTVLFWVVYCFRGQDLRFLLSGFVTFAGRGQRVRRLPQKAH